MNQFRLECVNPFMGEFKFTMAHDFSLDTDEKCYSIELVTTTATNEKKVIGSGAFERDPLCASLKLDLDHAAGLLKGSQHMRLLTRTRKTYPWGSTETTSLVPVELWGPLRNVTLINKHTDWACSDDIVTFYLPERIDVPNQVFCNFLNSLEQVLESNVLQQELHACPWKVYMLFIAKIANSNNQSWKDINVNYHSGTSHEAVSSCQPREDAERERKHPRQGPCSKIAAFGVGLTVAVAVILLLRNCR